MLREKIISIFKIIKYCFLYSPAESTILIINGLLCGLVPYLEIRLISTLIDSVSDAFENASIYSAKMVFLLLGLLITLSLYDIGDIIDDFFEKKLQLNLRLKHTPFLVKKISQCKYHYFEDETVVNLIANVLSEPEEYISNGFLCVANILQVIVAIISVTVSIFQYHWWAGIAISLLSIPLLFISYRGGKKIFDLKRDTQKSVRYISYLTDILTNRDNSIERTLFQYNSKVDEKFEKENASLRERGLKLNLILYVKSRIATILSLVASFIVIGILFFQTAHGDLDVSLFISTAIGVTTLMSNITGSFSGNLAEIAADCEYVAEEDKLMELSSFTEDSVHSFSFQNGIETIEFKNVSFRYPFSQKYALKNVSFILDKNSYAIVGTNGAGKSTIFKLLLRLYDSYSGEIFINGHDIKSIPVDILHSEISVLFQDSNKHFFSFKDNILIGDIKKPFDEREYQRVLKAVGLENLIEKLPQRDATLLGKIEEDYGVDLSGGEWQRIAIARVLYSHSTLKILDEPTSALDSQAEEKLYKLFQELSGESFSIIVSHRLSSALIANDILVFDNGRLVERGSARELLKKNGLFAQMFNEQRKWYNHDK